MATFKPVVFPTSNHIKQDGTTNIKVRLYHNKESQYISTPYYVLPEHMGKDGNITPGNKDYEILNLEIGNLIQDFRSKTIQLGNIRTSRMNCIELKEQIVASVQPDYEFIDFIAFSRKIISETTKRNTISWYETAINTLIWFFGRNKIDARDITGIRLNELIKKLSEKGKKGKPLDPGAINNYMRALRSLYNKCKVYYNQEDFDIIRIPNDPFKKIKLPQPKRKRKNLNIEDIKRIRDFTPRTTREAIGQDMFMIMFYLMGINVNDLYNVHEIRYGRIIYERSKVLTEDNINNFPLSIKVEPELKSLIEKYSENGVFLSKIKKRYASSNYFMDAINTGLCSICYNLDIIRATTNWARHSWASIARNKAQIAKADVDFCLGHVNNDYKMADIYIEIDYGIYDISNRKVLDLLK